MDWLEELSDLENRLVIEGNEAAKDFFDTVKSIIEYYNIAIKDKNFDEETEMFNLFFFQVRNSLMLAFLSVLRLHTIQSHLMLRYALESAVLAGYAIHHSDRSVFLSINELGHAIEHKNLKKISKKWIERHFPEYSETIKRHKEIINQYSAHANIISTYTNMDLSESYVSYKFFDNHSYEIIKSYIWEIGMLSITILEFIHKASQEKDIITFQETIEMDLENFKIESNSLREQLLNSEVFSKYNI
ncbi:hypothetical protein [Paenibacillus hunanensis]|uniref:HEPN AbiU2-like domain-containing protein n=1 Tax=Paenibacillus hunanensis TaxID=539262 RepID=A0ABU1IWC3_9BACL|nr:hypothetical protein [Paenibacillus hunanensis]MDR6243538.1 hypothetical protein [Paenibacillus hunanensis]GGI98456.1 hypothetical protein GCM10008022_04020 [Paenibacillus hunanensis]